ncbi:Protein of unknown function DUF2838 [Nannochloropsis gaditana]|uniref:Glycerophosphocholine acyltransferase 1 n=1 Tax=Nannochloropsis gaditana TaxID=72520 RepID=W7TS45_9STRA|nr:Protein of unknown function DUF2838 [Nannochloropsis gaditana]
MSNGEGSDRGGGAPASESMEESASPGVSAPASPDSMMYTSNKINERGLLFAGDPDRDVLTSAAATVAAASEAATMNGEVLRRVIGDLKELEGEAASSSVKAGIADQRRQLTALLRASVQKRWRKAVTGDEMKRVRDHIREPPVARRLDKLAFTFGVLNLTVSEFMLIKFPHVFWAWYMAVIPVLVFFRIPHYRSLKWGFFLLDFCYFVQVLCILQLYAFPSNCNLLKSIFLLANGPLAFAVPVWRNSLVFHDLEKITSLYIHVYPGLLLYALRWYPSSPSAAATLDACGSMDVKDLLPAAVVYLAWQIMYYVKIEILDRARLEADPELQTSLRWLAKDHKNALHRLVLRLTRATGVLAPDERFDHRTLKTKSIFILTQFIYTLLTCLPALVIYHSFQLHVAYGLGMFTVAVFNGANYYIDVFSVRYQSKYPRERPFGLGKVPVLRTTAEGSGDSAGDREATGKSKAS